MIIKHYKRCPYCNHGPAEVEFVKEMKIVKMLEDTSE